MTLMKRQIIKMKTVCLVAKGYEKDSSNMRTDSPRCICSRECF